MKKLLGLLLLVVIIGAAFTMGLYSRDTGRWPWQWSQEDWRNWYTFTRSETRAVGEDLSREAQEKALGTWKWVGKNTQALYDRSRDLLAQLGGSTQEGAPAVDREGTGSRPATPPDPLDEQSPNYRYGKEWLRKGIDEWRVSLVHPGAAERARSHFEKAILSFEAAEQELRETAAVADWLRSAREYLADTEERQQLIRREAEGAS
jgi:hypothetical protein